MHAYYYIKVRIDLWNVAILLQFFTFCINSCICYSSQQTDTEYEQNTKKI